MSVGVLAITESLRAEVTATQVRDAISRAVEDLKGRQTKPAGSWGELGSQAGGLTGLVTLALLSCGESADSPTVKASLQYLESLGNPQMVYATSLQTMVFCAANPQRYRVRIGENVAWLEQVQQKQGNRSGSWGYSDRQGNGDNSNAQFALLALYEAERIGVRVDEQVWRRAIEYWKGCQNQDGSWSYTPGEAPTGSMTCAGIASLVIASGRVAASDSQVVDGEVRCCGTLTADDTSERIARGLTWLGRHYRTDTNPSAGGAGAAGSPWLFYYLYGVERVGRLTGQRYFLGPPAAAGRPATPPRDWYREGAEFLVKQQDELQGYWRGSGIAESNPVVATSLALLFLSKGRRPVAISRLRYDDEAATEFHQGGVPNLTRRLELRWKRDLTTQTIDLGAATLEDLLQSPVLFISGRSRMPQDPAQRERLKQYVTQGGFLFVEACQGHGCNGQEFDADFRRWLREMFPDSTLRLLPPDHPVWFAEQPVDARFVRPLYGLDSCCRTGIVYCPETLACYWNLAQLDRPTQTPPAIQPELEAVLRIGENVVTYATNRELKDKLDRPTITLAKAKQAVRRGAVFVPKLSHSGGADEAANAWPNLLTYFAQQTELDVIPETRLIAATDEDLADFPLLFMHGRRAFRFTATEREALREYLRRGGFLFADSICAQNAFTDSFRHELKMMFPESRLVRIGANHPLLSNQLRGFDISSVTLRDPQSRVGDDPLVARQVKTEPWLEALEIDGRLAVVFSPYDVSCALENQTSLDCKGYIKADAAKIAVNVLLYALQQ
ncbi:MAG: DUF4159 domain-containing protein [Planctomycetota bacterium]